jgi:hypothetical protein
MLTSVTLGATPAVPSPLMATGSLHDWSGSSSHGPSIGGMSVVKFRLNRALKLGLLSGWDLSMPVS